MRSGSGTGTMKEWTNPRRQMWSVQHMLMGWRTTLQTELTLCRLPVLLHWRAWQGEAGHDLCPEAECSSAPEMNWEAAEVGRDFPFPSGRTGDRNFPLCSQSQTVSGFTGSWSSKAQTKAAFRCLLGGRRNSFIPSLQLQHCNYMLGWKTQPPLLLSREIKVKNCYVPESSALSALENILSENIFITPITAITEEWELKDFFNSLFLHFHTFSEPFYIPAGPTAEGQMWQVPCQVFPWHAKWHILSPQDRLRFISN